MTFGGHRSAHNTTFLTPTTEDTIPRSQRPLLLSLPPPILFLPHCESEDSVHLWRWPPWSWTVRVGQRGRREQAASLRVLRNVERGSVPSNLALSLSLQVHFAQGDPGATASVCVGGVLGLVPGCSSDRNQLLSGGCCSHSRRRHNLPCGMLTGSKPREPPRAAGGGEHIAGGCRCVYGHLPGVLPSAPRPAAREQSQGSPGSRRVQSPPVAAANTGRGRASHKQS